MMRLMIDTNIILDVLLEREPFFKDSRAVLDLCESKKVLGFISASTATDIFYLVRKSLKSTEEAYTALGHILNIVRILTVTNDDVNSAFTQHAPDFEDCLLATCAKSNKCAGIVTRNKKDFLTFGISTFSPEEVIELTREKGTVPNSLYDEKSPVIVHKRKKPGLRRSQDEKPFYIRQSDVVVIPPEPFCG